jgi:ribosomal protein L37AE/L43A
MTEAQRRAIFYCPYCGSEDLRPQPEPPGAWHCPDCTSSFVVQYVRERS